MLGGSEPSSFNGPHMEEAQTPRPPKKPRLELVVVIRFKSFLLGSQDLKVNLCGLQQDKCSDGKGKNNDVGIARRFPCYSYTVVPYGK